MARKFDPPRISGPRIVHPQKALREIIEKFGRGHASKRKEVSHKTKQERINTLVRCFEQLAEGGYVGLQPRNIAERHIRYLVQRWEGDGLAAKTLKSYYSQLNNLLRWLGRTSAIRDIKYYLKDPESAKSVYAVQEDESWNGTTHQIDVLAVIDRVSVDDAHIGMSMKLQHAFGLRVKESLMMKPHVSDRGNYLDVIDGTKGGRPRTVAIRSAYQREVIDQAKALVHRIQGRIGENKGYDLKQAYNRYYYVVTKKHAINQKNFEVTSHGLRKQYACDRYQEIAGVAAPVRGGERVDAQTEDLAKAIVIEELGHSRMDKMTAYAGSWLPEKTVKP